MRAPVRDEVLSEQEHLIALDFSVDYEPCNPHQWAETEGQGQVFYREQWGRLAAAGGFVFYAHPLKTKGGGAQRRGK